MLFEVGKQGPGMIVLLSGRVEFSRRDALGRGFPIWDREGRGHALAEVGQLSGALSLLDIQARGPVEAVLLRPDALRTLLVAEVELGDRILRTLTLRRLGLLALGFGGPVLIGSPADARLRGHSRNSLSAAAIRIRSWTRRPTRMLQSSSPAMPRVRTISRWWSAPVVRFSRTRATSPWVGT